MSARTGRYNGTPAEAWTLSCDVSDECKRPTVAIVLCLESQEWLSMCSTHVREETWTL